jgi:peroxiredoxin
LTLREDDLLRNLLKIRIFAYLLVVHLSCLTGCSVGDNEAVGLRPSARFTMLNGSYTSLYAFRGKKVIVVFWATPCRKSRKEIKRINTLAGEMSSRKDVVFLAISLDKAENQEKLSRFIVDNQLNNLKHVFSGNDYDDEAFIVFYPKALPRIYVIDPSGQVVADGGSCKLIKKALEGLR